jgi:hypothetical protein
MIGEPMDEITAKDVDRFKEQATADLDVIIERFNKDLGAWEARTQCRANFRWNYEDGAGKRLAKSEVVMPVYTDDASSSDVDDAVKKLQEAQPAQVKPA